MGLEMIPQMPAPGRPITADWGRDVVRCLRSMWPLQGAGSRISRSPNGTMIDAGSNSGGGSSGSGAAEPFAVRWHQHDSNKGEWEVYIPWGCATVGGRACIPKNAAANDADGNPEIGWFTIDIEEGDSVDTIRDNNKVFRSYPVYALMKPWPSIKVSSKEAEYDKEKWLGRRLIALAQEAKWSSGGSNHTSHRVVQYITGNWSEAWSTADLFAIRYDPKSGDTASDPNATWLAKLTNMTVTCGRFQVSLDGDKDVSGMEDVVLKINHSSNGEYSLEIVDVAEDSTDDATFVTLYSLDHKVVVADKRTNITTMPFFDV